MRADCTALRLLGVFTAALISSSSSARVVSGQTVCKGGPEWPCYKIAYFRDMMSRVVFKEALLACEVDGGSLLSVESAAEQQHIEHLLQELRSSSTGSSAGTGPSIADGDFWIGLNRTDRNTPQEHASFPSCSDRYRWTDGSVSQFRNWYYDEPSCGGEDCVVMYHQPTALNGLGGPYLYQWNDDRCNMKHNFICKYEPGYSASTIPCDIEMNKNELLLIKAQYRAASRNKYQLTYVRLTESHLVKEQGDRPGGHDADSSREHEEERKPPVANEDESIHVMVAGPSSMLLIYVIIPTIPLLLLILVASGTCCFQMLSKRKPRTKTSVNQSTLWISKTPKSDSAMEV